MLYALTFHVLVRKGLHIVNGCPQVLYPLEWQYLMLECLYAGDLCATAYACALSV